MRLRDLPIPGLGTPDDEEFAFDGLQWMTAALFFASGLAAALDSQPPEPVRRGPRRRRPDASTARSILREGARWAPIIVGPLAATAHAARAAAPNSATRRATQLADGMATGVAAVALAGELYQSAQLERDRGWWPRPPRPLTERLPALSPLTFAATGILGLLLDAEETEEAAERRQLQQRARILDRVLPRRHKRRALVLRV